LLYYTVPPLKKNRWNLLRGNYLPPVREGE
jgi:hypothetical protein